MPILYVFGIIMKDYGSYAPGGGPFGSLKVSQNRTLRQHSSQKFDIIFLFNAKKMRRIILRRLFTK